MLMNHILGGGDFTSRLFNEVREKRGLAYSVGSSLVNYDHASALVISTATRSDRAAETIKVIRDEVKLMADEGRDGGRSWPRPRNTSSAPTPSTIWIRPSSIASTLVGLQTDGLGIDYIQRRVDLINKRYA